MSNRWLLNKARGQQCQLRLSCCNHNQETVVAAHVNLRGHGKMGGKTSDLHVVWACSACHDVLDGRVKHDYDSEYVRMKGYEGVLRTQLRLAQILSDKERKKLGEAL